MASFTPDIYQAMTPHLTIRDLCMLMQVSRAWFTLWVSNRMWQYQKQRICAYDPLLGALFEQKKKQNKKRHKSEWVIPKKGTWYVFKHYLSLACTEKGIKKLCKQPNAHCVVFAMMKTLIPQGRTNILKCTIVKSTVPTSLYYVNMWTNADVRFTCRIGRHSNRFGSMFCELYHPETGCTYLERVLFGNIVWHFQMWVTLLYQLESCIVWTPLFEQLMQ